MKTTILFLTANPTDTSRLKLDEELREVRNGLDRSKERNKFSLVSRGAVRARDVQNAMLDYKPNIIHFSGHGDSEGIFLQNEVGSTYLVKTNALASLFELFAERISCVVLNSCYSERQAQTISKYVPYVIGMSNEIDDRAAIEFSIAFYSAIGSGESVDFAYKSGCLGIQLNVEDSSECLKPKLKRQVSSKNVDEVFDPQNMSVVDSPSFERKSAIISEKINSQLDSKTNPHHEMIQWVRRFVDVSGEKITEKVIHNNRNSNLHIPSTTDEIEDFTLDVKKFVKRVCYSLAHNNKKVITSPRVSKNIGMNTFHTDLYRDAFNEIISFTPDDISRESQNKFEYYSNYLLNRIF